MSTENRIRIIKRAQRENDSEMAVRRSEKGTNLQKSARKVVTSWVKEFQQSRYRRAGRKEFALLFVGPDSSLQPLS
jgi:hypothetical protein